MSDDLHYQCRLARNNTQQTAWIPERGAIEGAFIELKDDDTMWEVIAVYQPPQSGKYIREKQKMDRGSLLSIKPIK